MSIRFFLIQILIFASYTINAQFIYFNNRIDISGDWDICSSIITTGNGYFVVGDCGPTRHIYLSKLDSSGIVKWTKTYDTPGYTYYMGLSGALFQTKDKYYAFCGARVPQPKGYSFLIKVDSIGNKKWEKEYKLADYDNRLNNGIVAKDSGFILTGDAITGSPGISYLLLKTDSMGNQQWYKTYTDNHPLRKYQGTSVIQTPDNGYCLGGYGGYYEAGKYKSITEIIKTDEQGNQQWKKTYGNPLNCNTGVMLCLSRDNNIIGSYSLCNSGDLHVDRQIYLTKIGLDGTEIWNKKIGNKEIAMWVSWVETLTDGCYIVSGNHGIRDTIIKNIGWLFKLSSNGDSIWYREYVIIPGAHEVNEIWQVTPTPDKGFACAGSLYPTESGGSQDIWIFKTDSMGCLVPNCDGVVLTEFNTNISVGQMVVFPNPFKDAFALNYSIPKENKTAIFQLYDIYGKLVYQIGLTTSVNQLQVVASSLKAGMYVACLVVDGKKIASQIIIKE
jgi:hypothetical protein